MKILATLLVLLLAVTVCLAQTPSSPPATPAGSTSMTSILPQLDRLQSAAAQANLDIGHMRIEKWKTDSDSKQQAQANADSIQRNLTSALPGLIDSVRSSPQDVGAEFKLYRNLNALYDVFASLTESAGAFGPRNDYETLAGQLNVIDSVRRDLGNSLEGLTTSTQTELNQLRAQVRTLQQKEAAAPPKKIIVDDTTPAKKTTAHRKKTTKPTASEPATSGTSSSTSAKSQ